MSRNISQQNILLCLDDLSSVGAPSISRQSPASHPAPGLVLNLCPALMNETIPALRYEVAARSDETQP
ncbi:hypothetical protein NQZ68_021647 [Dissostichus eleginoides]|nr:hypothetical protein NQZ68_021647 [Dissostichus eleginoides]